MKKVRRFLWRIKIVRIVIEASELKEQDVSIVISTIYYSSFENPIINLHCFLNNEIDLFYNKDFRC